MTGKIAKYGHGREKPKITLTKIAAMDIHTSCTEMALFELLKTAEHPQFKQIAKLIK